MKIKVCGMRNSENIKQLTELPIDYIGLIFHPKSPRYFLLENTDVDERLRNIPSHIKKVGVVVNESLETVRSYINNFNLDCIQLHGKETAEYCRHIKERNPNIEVIKAISVSSESDIALTNQYQGDEICDYLLFDTKTPQHGGSGMKFDWDILNAYKGNKPFLLSGGISITDADDIRKITHPMFIGVDLNSRFEIEPGMKNIELLQNFINKLKQ